MRYILNNLFLFENCCWTRWVSFFPPQVHAGIISFNIFGASARIKLGYKEFVYSGSPIENFKSSIKNDVAKNDWVKNKIEVPLISKKRTEPAIKFNNFEELVGWKSKFNVNKYTQVIEGNPRFAEFDSLSFSIKLIKNKEEIKLSKQQIISIIND
ncbi:hypothetical protein [Spiroplasma endosymbiont of Nebria brevicollis]|uniref:hypothetical protein n=1 Tax=Spiroplasma endosymbiont of Nebria brevicollis TaxID=3066284 RepID=UPI00313EC5CF